MQYPTDREAGSPADLPAETEGIENSCRETARRIEKANRRWLVMWGVFSREYWAYPLFSVPSGTIMHAADAEMLMARMREVELASMSRTATASRRPGR
jgi:muconolactone delta-isomerase